MKGKVKMRMFIAFGLVFSVTIGLFMSLVIISMCDIKNKKKKRIAIIVLAFVIGFLIGGTFCLQTQMDNKNWNNGFCLKCGGQYELTEVTHIKNSGNLYYYTCKDCGYTIKLETLKNN